MHRFSTYCGMAMLSAVLFAATAMAAESEVPGDVANGRKIFLNGKGDDVPACASCHGEDGLGKDDMGTPRLAYQVYTYLRKQLEDFAADKRFDNTLQAMNDIAKALTPQDREDVAAYVHTLKTPFLGSDLRQLREDGEEVGEAYKGRVIVEYGLPDHGVPACKSCHGFHGRSAGHLFPAIGGQRYKYLVHELEAFREGATGSREESARFNDPKSMMRNVAKHLTDEDIKNVAAFLTSAKPGTAGNPVAPQRAQF